MSTIVRRLALAASALLLVPLVQLVQPVPGSAAAAAHVRVNQVGYVQDRAKQAFVLSTADHEGEPFELVGDGDVVVFSGMIGADRGPWNERYVAVNQIDFDAFADPGVYVLKVAGATSPPFRVGTGSDSTPRCCTTRCSTSWRSATGPTWIRRCCSASPRTSTTATRRSTRPPSTTTGSSSTTWCRPATASTRRGAGSTRATT